MCDRFFWDFQGLGVQHSPEQSPLTPATGSKSAEVLLSPTKKITIIKSQGVSNRERPKLLPVPDFNSGKAAEIRDFLGS